MADYRPKDDYVTIDRSWFREQTKEAIETFFLPVTALVSAYKVATRPDPKRAAKIAAAKRAARRNASHKKTDARL